MMLPTTKPVFDILAQTPEILVLQTNAGESLPVLDVQQSISEAGQQQSTSVASASYGRFNLGLHVQDDPAQVLSNRAQLLSLINAQLGQVSDTTSQIEAIYWLSQIHSNQVVRIKPNQGLSLVAPQADAMVSDLLHQALAIMTADCVPIVLYDPNSKQIAAIHAGWQGLANGVIATSYAEMSNAELSNNNSNTAINNNVKNNVKSNGNKQLPDNLASISQKQPLPTQQIASQQMPVKAWIGTCISQACYEVSTEVVDKLLAGCEQLGMDTQWVRQQVVGDHDQVGKAWLDLPKLAQLQLQQLGVEVQRFDAAEDNSGAYACSYRNNNYYSYRRQTHLGKANTGRMAMLIVRL